MLPSRGCSQDWWVLKSCQKIYSQICVLREVWREVRLASKNRYFPANRSVEFPCEAFLEHLFEMAIDFVQSQAADHSDQNFYILKAELAEAVRRVETALSAQADSLRMAYALRARRSPKRGLSVDDSEPSRLVNVPVVGIDALILLDYPLRSSGEEFRIQIVLPLAIPAQGQVRHFSINVYLRLPHRSRRQPWILIHLISPSPCFAL